MNQDTEILIGVVILLLLIENKKKKVPVGGATTEEPPSLPPGPGIMQPGGGQFGGGGAGGSWQDPVDQNTPVSTPVNTVGPSNPVQSTPAPTPEPQFPPGAPIFPDPSGGEDHALVSAGDPSILHPELCTPNGGYLLCPLSAF